MSERLCKHCGHFFDTESKRLETCASCKRQRRRARVQKWRLLNPEKDKEKSDRFRAIHRDEILQKRRAKYWANPELFRERRRKWLQENWLRLQKPKTKKKCVICGKMFGPRIRWQKTCGEECRKVYRNKNSAKWYADNAQLCRERTKAWVNKNLKGVQDYHRRNYLKNPDKYKQRAAEWAKKNPEARKRILIKSAHTHANPFISTINFFQTLQIANQIGKMNETAKV